MKIEKRGKYPGVKVHLDGDEARRIMEDCVELTSFNAKLLAKGLKNLGQNEGEVQGMITALEHASKLAKKIAKEFKDYPSLFDERTEEEIKVELETEFKASGDKLAAMNNGKDWKGAGK